LSCRSFSEGRSNVQHRMVNEEKDEHPTSNGE
jgi:hypothetical protein